MQARGLKHSGCLINKKKILSRLMQARGLKHLVRKGVFRGFVVAPHAGAWIETFQHRHWFLKHLVAPHAGAWIETILAKMQNPNWESRASCRRVD